MNSHCETVLHHANACKRYESLTKLCGYCRKYVCMNIPERPRTHRQQNNCRTETLFSIRYTHAYFLGSDGKILTQTDSNMSYNVM